MAEKDSSQNKNDGLFLVINQHIQQKQTQLKEKTIDKEVIAKPVKTNEEITIEPNIKPIEKERKDPNFKKEHQDNFNLNRIKPFLKNNSKWLIPVLLILIAISVSTYLRMMPAYLPVTDDWAKEDVYNFYRLQITAEIDQQYFNVPEENRKSIVEQKFQEYLDQNKKQINREIANQSQQYKAQFQDENGKTYLLEMDPYLWYSEARNVVNYGHLGDKIIKGKSYFTLRDGRIGKEVTFQLHPYVCAYMYKFLHFFNRDLTLMEVMFLMPVILIGLAIIPTFFIGKKIAGNVGGFFVVIFLAINGPLLSKTSAGFSDTDAYVVLFSLFIVWLFLEAYATKNKYFQIGLIILSGLFVGIFAVAWGGWSFSFFLILGTITATFIFNGIINFVKNKCEFSLKILKESYFKKHLALLAVFLVSSGVFVSLFNNANEFIGKVIFSFKGISTIKMAVSGSLWPKVQATINEFQVESFSTIIENLGGKIFILIAVIGILFTLRKKNEEKRQEIVYFFLLLFWLTGTIYLLTKGKRFSILMAPAFALALGSALGLFYEKGNSWLRKELHLNKSISNCLVIFILCLLVISPLTKAQENVKDQIPLFSDAWYDTLIKIKQDSTDSIITSWWDFGHWFPAIAERRVTFDGGDQNEKKIHWVGKILLTNNEAEAIGILRMLNCAQETALEKLNEFTQEEQRSINMLYEIFPIADRAKAKQKYIFLGLTKEQAEIMLEYTHCKDLLPNYFITYEYMASISPTWGHFGGWNFERAKTYETVRKLPLEEAISYLTKELNTSITEAEKMYNNIKEIENKKGEEANLWVAPAPQYSSISRCENISENKLRCITTVEGGKISLLIDLGSLDVSFENKPEIKPHSLVFATETEIEEKLFSGKTLKTSVILIPTGEGYFFLICDPLLARSTFTKLFFFEGRGMKCFSKFDVNFINEGWIKGKIATWKIDYNCQQENKISFLPESSKTQ